MAVVVVVATIVSRSWIPRLPPPENCNLVISAARRPAPDEVDPHLSAVQWGIVEGNKHHSLLLEYMDRLEDRDTHS